MMTADAAGLFRHLRRTSAARIVAMYLAVFVASTGIVLGAVTWAALTLIDQQIDQTLDAEVRGLAEQYRIEGLGRLIEVVRARSGAPRGRPLATTSAAEAAPAGEELSDLKKQARHAYYVSSILTPSRPYLRRLVYTYYVSSYLRRLV